MPVPMQVIWLIAIVVFCILEGVTAHALVSIWFVAGSLAGLITSLLTPSILIQVVVFLVVSLAALALVRPIAKKYFTPKMERTNADRVLGEQAVVTETIDNLAGSGQVNLKGRIWTARCEDDTPLAPGTQVTVVRIEGVKVIVRKAN